MDPQTRRKALRLLDYNLVLVGTRAPTVVDEGADLHAFLGSWAMQCSFSPPLVAIGVRKDGRAFPLIRESGVFSVNVLGAGQKEVAVAFLRGAEAGGGRMGGLRYERATTGAPLFPETAGFVECEVRHLWDAEGAADHAVVVGEVVGAGLGSAGAEPLRQASTGFQYGG